MDEYTSVEHGVACRAAPGAFVVFYRGPGIEADVEPMRRVRRSPALGRQAVMLLFIQPRVLSDAPDAAFRTEAAKIPDEPGTPLVARAHVVCVDGFLGSVARSILTSWNAIANPGARTKTFARLDDGLGWLRKTLPDDVPAIDRIPQHLEELRAALRL